MNEQNTLKVNSKSNILTIIKGSFWGVSFSLVCILLFALIIKFSSISENAIGPINQIIKVLSILFACFVVGKQVKKGGLFVGLFTGILYTILAFVIFSILDGGFSFGLSLLNDITFGAIIGLISGVLCINLRNK